MKQKIKKELKFYGRKGITAFVMAIVFVTVAGTSIWALAAFTEPTDTPSNSVQDWAKNIMGANNSDNAFDSSDVTANSDGSIIERLESLETRIDNDYSACYTINNWDNQPVCVSGHISITSGQSYDLGYSNEYVYYNVCCIPR